MDDIKRPRFWAARLRQYLNALPCFCEICARPAVNLLCEKCRLGLAHNDKCCVQCAEELPTTMGRVSAPQSTRCGRCISNPPAFQQTFFAYDYNGPVAKLIQRFKFNEALILNHLLADMITSRLKAHEFPLPDALIPVPLHPARLKQRGFNQSFELSVHCSRALKIPLISSSLRRRRNTPAQSGLSSIERRRNLRHAFYWTGTDIQGLHIALVDDVLTTGSTVTECAKLLLRNGAARVDVWTAARAVPKH